MKNEAEFKSLIKKSISSQKGYSISLAAPMLSGIPDLYCVMPSYIPVLLEAKFLGEIKRSLFTRKIPFSPMQELFLKSCHEVSPFSAMGIIGFIYEDQLYAALVAYGTPLFYNFNSTFKVDCAWVAKDERTKKLDILELFGKVPIPRIRELSIRGLEDVKYETDIRAAG